MFSLCLLILSVLINVTSESIVDDILLDTERFFSNVAGSLHEIYNETEKFKLLVKRSYGLSDADGHLLWKRSLDEKTTLIRDEKGVYFVKGIENVAEIPAKFPSDIQIVLGDDSDLYIAALECTEDLPQTKLASELVLYRLKGNGSPSEVSRIPVSGGYRLASYTFRDVTYLLASEHDADVKNPFEGTSLYRISVHSDQLLEKIQILNITHPRDVKFWQHQDEMYLAVGSTESWNAERSQTLIFKWLGDNFDFIQKIDCGDITSVTPFVIGSHMYLAVANQQDEHGNTHTDSEIFRFHLQSRKFVTYQKIKTQAASDIAHFKFTDSKSKKEEHFLAIANFYERLYDDSPQYRTDSVVYKFEADRFVPFQNFKLNGVLQWLPIQGTNGEFLLLAVCSNTVIAFQYDGWRFTEVGLDFGPSSFGRDVVRMKSFERGGDIFLMAADKGSDGTGVNLWKVLFEKENILEDHRNHLEKWCKSMKLKIEEENLDGKIKKLHSFLPLHESGSSGVKFRMENAEIETLETDSFDVYNVAMVEDLNNLNRRVKNLKSELEAAKERIEKEDFVVYYDLTDLDNIPFLELDCSTPECCSFENLNIGTLNGVDYVPFINNAVVLHENVLESKMEFENIVITHDLALTELNGHPAATIVDTQTDLYLNSELVVNGTVIMQGDLRVNERFVKDLKSEDDLLQQTFQNFTGELILNSAKIKNLEISGKINDVDVDKLLQNETVKLADNYEKLNVHNLFVNGPIVELDRSTEDNNSRDGNESDREFDTLEVDEVVVESNVISDTNISDIIQTTDGAYYKVDRELNFTQPVLLANFLQVTGLVNGISVKDSWNDSDVDTDHIIVEGTAVVRDILNPEGNHSVFDIINHGVLLNQTVIDEELEFDQVQVDDVTVESINNIPVSSWVLKDSPEVQIIKGKKTIKGDLFVGKSISIKELNGIQLDELMNDTLYLDGEQTVHGSFVFDGINATGLVGKSISLRGEELALKPKVVKILGSATFDNLTVENATVRGLVDGLSWEDIVRDSVFGEGAVITGKKTVEGVLEARKIYVTETINSIPVEDFLKDMKEEVEFEIEHDLYLNHTLFADSMTFEGSLDSIESYRFGKEWLLTEGDQTIQAPMYFKSVVLEAPSILQNETINNVNLKRMFRDSVKVNKPAHIKYLAVNNMRVKNLQVPGTVNGAKFEESVVLAKSDVPQVVEGEWFFDSDLVINGSLTLEGFVSGVNVTHLCLTRQSQPKDINLIVGGSVRFDKEPKIHSDVNGVDLKKLLKEIWLKNEDSVLEEGQKKFCSAEFEGKINLKGRLNDLDLEDLSKNYFSKTTTKFVPEDLTAKNIIIRKSCRVRDVTLGGNVNGLNLEEWSKTVLLQDEDQVITGNYNFGEFSVKNLVLNGTVNDLDLNNDVLRYDVQDAVVTGKKTFMGLRVRNLVMDKGKRVQDVAVDDWARRAVRTVGNFVLEGNLTIHGAVFNKGLRVAGKVNDLIFDREHILTTKGGQKITGRKKFDLRNYPNKTLKVEHLTANGKVSGVDIDSLMKNQAFKDGDSVFTGRKTFLNLVSASALTVGGLFQGENITEICEGVRRPPQLEDLTEKYEQLLAKARQVNEHFKEEPFFLDNYETVQTLTDDVFALLPASSNPKDAFYSSLPAI
ncbi:UNVERIFIED_CONTAM: hypothetical protein PYX00_006037 [Menopon gallinae]|uniref:Uncharacterized protein n=1 Tax=Menopon gallinae TaxID=328185 RepID=A0AAW2HUD3_9NEOP